jgi:hypothetical protein
MSRLSFLREWVGGAAGEAGQGGARSAGEVQPQCSHYVSSQCTACTPATAAVPRLGGVLEVPGLDGGGAGTPRLHVRRGGGRCAGVTGRASMRSTKQDSGLVRLLLGRLGRICPAGWWCAGARDQERGPVTHIAVRAVRLVLYV